MPPDIRERDILSCATVDGDGDGDSTITPALENSLLLGKRTVQDTTTTPKSLCQSLCRHIRMTSPYLDMMSPYSVKIHYYHYAITPIQVLILDVMNRRKTGSKARNRYETFTPIRNGSTMRRTAQDRREEHIKLCLFVKKGRFLINYLLFGTSRCMQVSRWLGIGIWSFGDWALLQYDIVNRNSLYLEIKIKITTLQR